LNEVNQLGVSVDEAVDALKFQNLGVVHVSEEKIAILF